MTNQDPNAYIEGVLDGIRNNASQLARQRCGNIACGFQGVVLEVSEPSQRVEGSNMVWLEDMTHGVACTFDEGCFYGQNLDAVSTVFTDAIQKTIMESGIVGLVDSGASGTQQAN